MRLLLAVLLALVALAPVRAEAHGIWGHIHVTGWAIENLPPGEVRDFFGDPEVFNAALFGAAFTDSGYFPQSGALSERSRAYSEHTHWEPFVQDFIVWILENDPPPWDDLESRKRAAFLIGAACHGLQDEIFDSIFLLQVAEEDDGGQGEADPGSDGFLVLDAHLRFVPEPYVPIDTLVELYEVLDRNVDADTIEQAVELMEFLYVREGGWLVAEGLGNQYSEEIPWTRAHYMDPDIPGSLRAEINPTAAHIEALWERLHGRFDADDVVVATYPDVPRRLLSHQTDTPDSLVTLIFGAGVERDSVATHWHGEEGDVEHRVEGTRWGADHPRLIRLDPGQELVPGGTYTAGLVAGASLIDGSATSEDFAFEFQVACTDDEGECEPIDPPVPSIDGPAPWEDVDAGEDAGADTGPDAGADVVSADAGMDIEADGTPETPTTSGKRDSGCATAASGPRTGLALLLLLAAQASIRIGRRRRPQSPGAAS